jgi:gas vesicle protein
MARNDIPAGGLLVAFIAGAVAGAAVALLYAPAAGEDTREYLGQRAREGRDRARQNLTTAFEKARQQYDAATRDREPEPEA